jgi:hypothetical protein
MEELYKKVMRGIYPKISSRYSEDLSDVLKLMIQVEVGARPSCEELLKMPMIYKRIEFFNENKDLDINNEQTDSINQKFQLLKTINVPKKLENLGKNLPKPNYNTETNKSFQNNESPTRKKYGGLTLDTEILPNVKKQSIQKKRNVLKKSDDSKDDDNEKISDIINNSNGSINSQPRRYANEERIPKSVPKNKKYESNHHIINNSNDNINKYIILPNLYSNRAGINNKNNSSSPKKSINLVKKKNINEVYKVPNNVKIIDGRNINGNNKNIISIKSGDKKINLLSDDYAKMLLDKNSGHKSNNYKLNDIYNIGVDERNFLRILQQRKKRMMYIGKV